MKPLPKNCQSKEDGICRLPINSCAQCVGSLEDTERYLLNEWHKKVNIFLHAIIPILKDAKQLLEKAKQLNLPTP